ncbi:methyltransferase [Candidatus Pacearchaeota archaeon]|nr:methyltransferase [Candidatus Pacearchaeota archaeon]
MVYQPREDSHLLQEEIRKLAKDKSVLDLGSGSGIQARTAVVAGAKSVLASDINQEAVNHLISLGLYTIRSDLFSNIAGQFDLIIFNPPYLPEDRREDKQSSLTTSGGKRGDELTIKFLKEAKEHLTENGIILLIVSSLTPKDKIFWTLHRQDFSKTVLSSKKLAFEELEVWKIMKNL